MKIRPVPIKPEHHLGGLAHARLGADRQRHRHGPAPDLPRGLAPRGDPGRHCRTAARPTCRPSATRPASRREGTLDRPAPGKAPHRRVLQRLSLPTRPLGHPVRAVQRHRQVPAEGAQGRHARQPVQHRQHNDLAGYRQYLDSINTVEVFAKARVPHGPEVNGMRELKAYLLKERKDDIAGNVIRRLLSYGLGRHLTYRDRLAVEELFARGREERLWHAGHDRLDLPERCLSGFNTEREADMNHAQILAPEPTRLAQRRGRRARAALPQRDGRQSRRPLPAAAGQQAPKRFMATYFSYGAYMPDGQTASRARSRMARTTTTSGAGGPRDRRARSPLSTSQSEPFEPLKDHVTYLRGLDHAGG